jgi:hypothetical protein
MEWPRACLVCEREVEPGTVCADTCCPWSLGVDDAGRVVLADHRARMRELDGGVSRAGRTYDPAHGRDR